MSDDTGAGAAASDDGAADRPARDAELLTAYVDGVAELSPDERRRIGERLAADPEARAEQAAIRRLLGQLRELPSEGNEPDWTAMERSIRQAVGPDAPASRWPRWRWLVPLSTFATATAVLFVMWSRPAAIRPASRPPAVPPALEDRGAREPRPDDNIVPLWLDGDEVDVDLSASELLHGPEIGDDDPAHPDGDADAGPDGADLLPASNLAWVDGLDDAAIERAERWLAGTAAPAEGQEPASSGGPSRRAKKKG